jgi:hypothetical protein
MIAWNFTKKKKPEGFIKKLPVILSELKRKLSKMYIKRENLPNFWKEEKSGYDPDKHYNKVYWFNPTYNARIDQMMKLRGKPYRLTIGDKIIGEWGKLENAKIHVSILFGDDKR